MITLLALLIPASYPIAYSSNGGSVHYYPFSQAPELNVTYSAFNDQIRFYITINDDDQYNRLVIYVDDNVKYNNTVPVGERLKIGLYVGAGYHHVKVMAIDPENNYDVWEETIYVGHIPKLTVSYSIESDLHPFVKLHLIIRVEDDQDRVKLEIYVDRELFETSYIPVGEEVHIYIRLSPGKHVVTVVVIDSDKLLDSWYTKITTIISPVFVSLIIAIVLAAALTLKYIRKKEARVFPNPFTLVRRELLCVYRYFF